MRARHRSHCELRGEKSEHRARGGGVSHPHNSIRGEGAAPKLHGAKRARGGSCDMDRKDGGGKWMQKAFAGAHGQFKAKARRAGMSTKAFANKESKSSSASTKTKRQANLAKLGMKYGRHHH